MNDKISDLPLSYGGLTDHTTNNSAAIMPSQTYTSWDLSFHFIIFYPKLHSQELIDRYIIVLIGEERRLRVSLTSATSQTFIA